MTKLTDAQIDFLARVSNGTPLRPADRAEDKVRQFCRRRDLVEFAGVRGWVITPAGRQALSTIRKEGNDE